MFSIRSHVRHMSDSQYSLIVLPLIVFGLMPGILSLILLPSPYSFITWGVWLGLWHLTLRLLSKYRYVCMVCSEKFCHKHDR